MNRLFMIFWSAVVIILIGLMTMLYVSLIPHFGQIGNVAFVVLCIFLVYGVIIGGFGTYHMICSWSRDRRVVHRGDVVAYLDRENSFTHLSAMHEQAKVLQPAATITEERVDYTDSMITELYEKGLSRRAISKALEIPYNKVQKLLEGKP